MKTVDYLKPVDQVTVTILSPDDSRLYQSTDKGYHTIKDAIRDALANAKLEINPEDCVFKVMNRTTAISHNYRLNAHGQLKLIV